MKTPVTLRIISAFIFALTTLALGHSSSARMSNFRSAQKGPGKLAFWVRDPSRHLPDGQDFPIQDAAIEASDERGECARSPVNTSITGYAYVLCRYGKVNIKISRAGYEDYTEDDYEFSQDETKEITLQKSAAIVTSKRNGLDKLPRLGNLAGRTPSKSP